MKVCVAPSLALQLALIESCFGTCIVANDFAVGDKAHPYVLPLIAHHFDGDYHWVVTEFAAEGDL